MRTTKKRILMNAFFKSQSSYCPFVWITCNGSLNTKINPLCEQCLQIVYNYNKSNFNELLVKHGSVSIHHQNLQKLAVDRFNVSWGLCPENVNELFKVREQIPYELRQSYQFQIPLAHSVFSGTESLKFFEPKIWALVPNEMKQLESLVKFRNGMKRWKLTSCPWRLCKRYNDHVFFPFCLFVLFH